MYCYPPCKRDNLAPFAKRGGCESVTAIGHIPPWPKHGTMAGWTANQPATGPAPVRNTPIASRAARAINPASLLSVQSWNPLATIFAA